jgi:hypothetical protein
MAQQPAKQTIVFDKNIGGKRQQVGKVSFPTSNKPVAPSQTTSNSSLYRKVELVVILLVSLVSILIACISLFNTIRSRIPVVTESQPTLSQPVQVQSAPIQVEATTATTPIVTPSITTTDPPQLSGGISTQARVYKYYASRGDGVTHLARKAMLDYLADHNVSLNGQQKLYFETNLTQISNPVYLEVGVGREFNITDMERLTREALSLSPQQQAAWNVYLKNYPLR